MSGLGSRTARSPQGKGFRATPHRQVSAPTAQASGRAGHHQGAGQPARPAARASSSLRSRDGGAGERRWGREPASQTAQASTPVGFPETMASSSVPPAAVPAATAAPGAGFRLRLQNQEAFRAAEGEGVPGGRSAGGRVPVGRSPLGETLPPAPLWPDLTSAPPGVSVPRLRFPRATSRACHFSTRLSRSLPTYPQVSPAPYLLAVKLFSFFFNVGFVSSSALYSSTLFPSSHEIQLPASSQSVPASAPGRGARPGPGSIWKDFRGRDCNRLVAVRSPVRECA